MPCFEVDKYYVLDVSSILCKKKLKAILNFAPQKIIKG